MKIYLAQSGFGESLHLTVFDPVVPRSLHLYKRRKSISKQIMKLMEYLLWHHLYLNDIYHLLSLLVISVFKIFGDIFLLSEKYLPIFFFCGQFTFFSGSLKKLKVFFPYPYTIYSSSHITNNFINSKAHSQILVEKPLFRAMSKLITAVYLYKVCQIIPWIICFTNKNYIYRSYER